MPTQATSTGCGIDANRRRHAQGQPMRRCSPLPAGNGAPTQRSMIEIAFRGTHEVIHTLDVDVTAVRTRSESSDVDADRVDDSSATDESRCSLTDLIEGGIEAGAFTAADPPLAAMLLCSALHRAFDRIWHQEVPYETERLSVAVRELFRRALEVDQRRTP
jgi:hypothetical protein